MATTTKAMLAAENAALRKQVADLKLEIEMHSKYLEALAKRSAAKPQSGRTDAMQAARDMAMRSGCVVKV